VVNFISDNEIKTFENEEDALKACKEFNGHPIHGQKLKVEMVDNRGGGRKRDASDNDECFQCGEKGHWARDCKNRVSARGGGRRKRSSSYSRYRTPLQHLYICLYSYLKATLKINEKF
jgi:RNA recognition motif-containing protein